MLPVHSKIIFDGDKVFIQNCGAKESTVVAGYKLTGAQSTRELESGQVFTIGSRSFMFEKTLLTQPEIIVFFSQFIKLFLLTARRQSANRPSQSVNSTLKKRSKFKSLKHRLRNKYLSLPSFNQFIRLLIMTLELSPQSPQWAPPTRLFCFLLKRLLHPCCRLAVTRSGRPQCLKSEIALF